ncbi:MAG: hypothetical protein ACK5TQ_11275, partial [Acetobacteraceae bacterium]
SGTAPQPRPIAKGNHSPPDRIKKPRIPKTRVKSAWQTRVSSRRHSTLYLYRHAIELGMKSTIATYGVAFGVDCTELHTTHNLKTLWKAFQGLLDAISHPAEEEGNSAAERVVMAFHEWDKHGDAFRYATQRNGSPIILRDYFIDLEQLRDVMEGFENFLRGVDGALDAARSEGP